MPNSAQRVFSSGEYVVPVRCATEEVDGMSAKRRALGRGLGALIPTAPAGDGSRRPVDVFFRDGSATRIDTTSPVSRETPSRGSDQEDGLADASRADHTGAGQDPVSAESRPATDHSPGRGAADSQGTDLAPVPGARYEELPVGLIRPNPKQPRRVFDDDDMAELVNSIKEIGVLQPVVVRPIPAEELERTAGQRPDHEPDRP